MIINKVIAVELAPLVIFAYNRKESLEKVIENINENFFSDETDLYVFSDHARSLKDSESVHRVREYISTISGFKSITVIYRENNYGLASNIIEGVTDVISRHGKVIVLEDDLITSKNFLAYMNKALSFYQSYKKVFCISGFSHVLPSLKYLHADTYFSYRPSSWGWATWEDEWCCNDWNVKDFDDFIKNNKMIKKFNRGGVDMSRMLKHCVQGKNQSWAIRWAYTMFKLNKYCVYPRVSKIQNVGFGKGATNCKGMDIYQTILDDGEGLDFGFNTSVEIEENIAKEFKYQYSYINKAIKKSNSFFYKLFS